MDIDKRVQYNDASQLYLYTVHVIEEINTDLEGITPQNYAGMENGLYYQKSVCIGARSAKVNKPPAFLTEPILTSNINGSHTFSFKMPRFYYDLSGNKKNNDLLDYLHNETRLLLQYYENIVDRNSFNSDGNYIGKDIELENLFINGQSATVDENIKTLVFIIKDIKEDITGQFFEFECNDIYINELSKIGTQIVMDTELQNNIGSAQDLIQYVLDESNSDWVFEGIENNSQKGFFNYVEQPIVAARDAEYYWYLFGLNDLQDSTPYLSFYKKNQASPTLDLSKYIDETTGLFDGGNDFTFYSPIKLTGTNYEIDLNLTKTDYQSITATANNNYIERVPITVHSINQSTGAIIVTTMGTLDAKAYYEYHGNFLVAQTKTVYDKYGKQFVTPCHDVLTSRGKKYKNISYYRKNGYLVTDGGIDNFVSNPNSFSNTNGWTFHTNKVDTKLRVTTTTFKDIKNNETEYSCLELECTPNGSGGDYDSAEVGITNNLFMDNYAKTQGLIKDETFIFIIKGQYYNSSSGNWDSNFHTQLGAIFIRVFNNLTNFYTTNVEQFTTKSLDVTTVEKTPAGYIYYDNKQKFYWLKFRCPNSYSQTQLQNIAEFKTIKGELQDITTAGILEQLGLSIRFDMASNYDEGKLRILDVEFFRQNIIKNKEGKDVLILPEPLTWLETDSNKKYVIDKNKLLSNYGTQPYYRYYMAPDTELNYAGQNLNDSKGQTKVLKYTCQRKLTDLKTDAGITLWYLYLIVNKDYYDTVQGTEFNVNLNASAALNEWNNNVNKNPHILGGYAPKKGKFLTLAPKLLEKYLYKDSAPNLDKFVYSSELRLYKNPLCEGVIIPDVPGIASFMGIYSKGTYTDENGNEHNDYINLPFAYTIDQIKAKGAGTYLCWDNTFNFENTTSTTLHKYFQPTKSVNNKATCPEDIIYSDIGTVEKDDKYPPIYTTLKIGTVSASNSNAFNIIQKCCETFNCWANFKVELVAPSLTAPDKFIMRKSIKLYDQYYTDISDKFSFKYQNNIDSIKRTVNSEDITTKTIVPANNNEYGKNGFCTIQRSKYNLSGENFIYNFKYYIKKKMLDEGTLNRDMYGRNEMDILPTNMTFDVYKKNPDYCQEICDNFYNNFCIDLKKRIWANNNDLPFGYIPTLHRINTKARDINDNLGIALTNKNEAYASYLVSTEAISEGEKLKAKAEDKLKQYTAIDGPKKMQEIVQGVTSWTPADVLKMMQELLADTQRFDSILETQKAIRLSTKEVYEKYDREYKMYSLLAELLEKESIFLQETFENKYHLYIQEGTWTSEDYYDDDKYYLDAASVAYTSGFPKVTYEIAVEPLINRLGFASFDGSTLLAAGYRLEPGHKTYIEDGDYFKDENGNDFREEVIISETRKYLDSPENNTITVQNFRTQFEDLFQRIAATTANLEFAQGMYARAASLINPDGSLQPQAVEKTFTNAKSISLTTDSSVVTGENGIIATNTKNPSEQTQLCGSGLRCTANGGKTWMTAITGNGINANAITSGQIATDKIFIGDPNNPQFKWDSEGITSFCEGVNSTNNYKYLNYYKFTRLNDLGFYGIDQVHTSGTTPNNGYYLRKNVSVNANIQESDYMGQTLGSSNLLLNPQCIFYVGWAGFKFKSGNTTSMEGLYFDNTNGLVMRDSGGKQRLQMNTSGLVLKDDDGKQRLQIGPLMTKTTGQGTTQTIYGFAVKDTGGHPVLFNLADATNSGIIGITGSINVLPTNVGYNVNSTLLKMGYTSNKGLGFNQEVCNITTSEVTGTETFLNPSILELNGKYSIIGNANKEPGVETTFYQYYTDRTKNLIGSIKLSTYKSAAERYWDIDKGEDGLVFTSLGGYTDLTVLETTNDISSSSYCQWGMRLEHSQGIYANMSLKKFGTFFSVNARDELQSMKYIGTVTLRAFGGYEKCYYPTLSFVAMPMAKQKQGCIFTPDIFVCKGLYSDNIECEHLLTKSISTGSSTEYMTISNLSSSNLCAVNIYSNPQGETIYIKDSILFGSDPNKKILANFSNAYLRGGSVTIYDNLAFSTDPNHKTVVDFNNADIKNFTLANETVADFNNANIKNFTLTPGTWADLIGSGWTDPSAVLVQLSLGNQFALTLDKKTSIIGIYYKSTPFITGEYNSSAKTISNVKLGGTSTLA